MQWRNTDLSNLYIATLAGMDGSRVHRRTLLTALVTLALAALAPTPSAFAQSAGDEQYADPLAGDGQGQDRQGSRGGGDEPGEAPAPSPAPTPAPATPSSPDAPTGDAGSPGTTAATPAAGESLPRTGAEPAPLVAAGASLLLVGALLRRQVARRDAA